MVRTPPTALAGKAGLYKRGMAWNLWWLGHSASAWTSCWGTQAGFPILWYGWAGQFPAWKSGCGGFFPRRRGENGPQVLCLRSCCRQGLWHLPFLYCGLLGRFILGFASFWRFSGGGRRRVYRALREGTLEQAQQAVARIVGRDTQRLDRAGVTRAAVETVAENFSDGVAAPLFYFFLGGAPLALCYKAINTMDSMVGYRNERYLYFGRWAARLDDGANWLPARLSALLLVAAAWLLGEDGRGAWRIWRRDRRNHASPNAAQTEAAMAGALGVQLAGPAWYFGIRVEKPTIGEHQRPIVPEDILRSNRLLYGGSVLCLGVLIGLRCALVLGGGIG